MENIIIVEGKDKYVFSNKKEAIEQYLGKDYYKLNEKEQYKRVKLRTLMNSTLRGIPSVDVKKEGKIVDVNKKQYIILDGETFLLSLAKNNDIVIYEKENANEFAIDIDKENLEKVAKEYIRINDCVNEIIQKRLQDLDIKKDRRDEKSQQKEK